MFIQKIEDILLNEGDNKSKGQSIVVLFIPNDMGTSKVGNNTKSTGFSKILINEVF
jgi:hypothetical protein